MMRTVLRASLLALLLSTNAFAFKLAVIDLQRVLLESESGKAAKQALELSTESKKAELDKRSKEFKDLKDKYEASAAVMTEKARADKERVLQEKQLELQNLYMQFQQEIQKQDGDMTQAILKNIEPIIDEIAKKDLYDLVLEKNEAGILYVPVKVDITDQIIRLYNQRKKK